MGGEVDHRIFSQETCLGYGRNGKLCHGVNSEKVGMRACFKRW